MEQFLEERASGDTTNSVVCANAIDDANCWRCLTLISKPKISAPHESEFALETVVRKLDKRNDQGQFEKDEQ